MACSASSVPESGAPTGGGAAGGGVSFGGEEDIGELRSILDRGDIPGPDTFDANGFFNEHFNAEPPATCGQVLCIAPGMWVGHDWLTGAQQATLQIALTTPIDPSTFQRMPLNLVVVVDHSGSMADDNRIDKVKAGLHTLIDNLADTDRLAIVEFDDRIDVDAPLTSELDRTALHAIVDGLTPRGATDIFDGLERGFQLLGDAPALDRQNRVILLSDGNATAGDTAQADIMQMAAGYGKLGIGLTTIGVGNDFDVQLMRGLAEQGAGNFYFLEDASAATEVFTEELDFFVQPIALDVQLQASTDSGYVFGEAVGSHLWQTEYPGGELDIPAAFVASRTSQAGEQGRRGGGSMIFIHLDTSDATSGPVAHLTLSFRTPGAASRISQTVTVDYGSDPHAVPDQPYLSAPEMAERFAMYNMFLGIRAATVSTDMGCAMAELEATRTAAAAWNQAYSDPDLTADIMLVDEYLANLSAHGAAEADDESYATTCAAASDPYSGPDPQPIDPPDQSPPYHGYTPLACSSGAPSGGMPIVLAALVAGGLRRRRR